MITTHHVPGTNVTAMVTEKRPGVWDYILISDDPDTGVIARGEMPLVGVTVTPDQVARIAFLLECDYPKES